MHVIREHQQKTFFMLRGFWPLLRGWCREFWVNREICDENVLFSINACILNEVLQICEKLYLIQLIWIKVYVKQLDKKWKNRWLYLLSIFIRQEDKFTKMRHIFGKMLQIMVSLKNDHLVEENKKQNIVSVVFFIQGKIKF